MTPVPHVFQPTVGWQEPDPLLVASWQLRYEVYCKNRRFEPENATGLEVDWHDKTSVTVVVEEGGIAVGCGRVILSSSAACRLPLQSEYKGKLIHPTCEFSRAIVWPQARIVPGETPRERKLRQCNIGRALYPTLYQVARDFGLEYAHAVVEPLYCEGFQRMYSPEAFRPLCKPYTVKHGSIELQHVAMQICMAEWGLCLERPLAKAA